MDLLDDAYVNGEKVAQVFEPFEEVEVSYQKVGDPESYTETIRILIKGAQGKAKGAASPTLGVIGRLGGIGARPTRIGLVSDGDGAVAALTVALKLAQMHQKGDLLPGDVIVTTHICPHAPVQPHVPVEFMGSPIDMETMNQYEVDSSCDAILSIDTTKGNNIMTHKGFSLSPVVKEGYILPVCPDLIRIMEMTSGQAAEVFPLSMQDITPYANEVYHLNSILQPATDTKAPVVGMAITTATPVAGSATGASHEIDIAAAATFAVETAKEFTQEKFAFYNQVEYDKLLELYGSMAHLQTNGADQQAGKELSQ